MIILNLNDNFRDDNPAKESILSKTDRKISYTFFFLNYKYFYIEWCSDNYFYKN